MDLYHAAVFLTDIAESTLAAGCGGWGGPPRTIAGQPARVEGMTVHIAGHAQRLRTSNPQELALWVEDVALGLPIRPMARNAWHHVAVWCPDLKKAVELLEGDGYRREVAGGTDREPAIFAYMTSDIGPRVELSDASGKHRLRAHLSGEVPPTVAAPPIAPFPVVGAAAIVQDRSALECVQASWSGALGARWHEVKETSVLVRTLDGDQELRMHYTSTIGGVSAMLIAPSYQCPSTVFHPGVDGAWDHVILRSNNLSRDVTRLRALGFRLEFHDIADDEQPRSFAMMSAREGTRIGLVAQVG